MDVPEAVRERVLQRVSFALAWDAPQVLSALGWNAADVARACAHTTALTDATATATATATAASDATATAASDAHTTATATAASDAILSTSPFAAAFNAAAPFAAAFNAAANDAKPGPVARVVPASNAGVPAEGMMVVEMPAPRSQATYWGAPRSYRTNWSIWDLERDADCVAVAVANARVLAKLPITIAQLARALRGLVGHRAVAVWTLAARALEPDPPQPTAADRAAPPLPAADRNADGDGDAPMASAAMVAWTMDLRARLQAAFNVDTNPPPIAGVPDGAETRLAPPLRKADAWGGRVSTLVSALADDASPPVPADALADALALCASPTRAAAAAAPAVPTDAVRAVLHRAVQQGVSAHELASAFAHLQRPDLVDAVVWHLLRLPVPSRVRRGPRDAAAAAMYAPFGPLPPELGLRILAELSPTDLVHSARRVCRAWRHLVALLAEADRRHAFVCAAPDWRRHTLEHRRAHTADILQRWPTWPLPVWCTCGQTLPHHVAVSLLSVPAAPPNGGLAYADIHPQPLPVARWARLRPARDVALALHDAAGTGLNVCAVFSSAWAANVGALLPFAVHIPPEVVRPSDAAGLAALAGTVVAGSTPYHRRGASHRYHALAEYADGEDGRPRDGDGHHTDIVEQLWEQLSDPRDAASWYRASASHASRRRAHGDEGALEEDEEAWRDAWRTIGSAAGIMDDADDTVGWDPTEWDTSVYDEFQAQHPEYAATVTAALEAADASQWRARQHTVRAGAALYRYAQTRGSGAPPVGAAHVAALDRLRAAFEAHCVLSTSFGDAGDLSDVPTAVYFVGLTRSGDLAGLWALMVMDV